MAEPALTDVVIFTVASTVDITMIANIVGTVDVTVKASVEVTKAVER